MRAAIHKRTLYISPRPKKDIVGGLYLLLSNGKEYKSDVFGGIKKYKLPDLPVGVWVVAAAVIDNEK